MIPPRSVPGATGRRFVADRAYAAALLFSLLFHLRHAFRLPILLTFDGYLYIDLADVLFSGRFPQDWDFLRTPLFPLVLKAGFAVFGKTPLGVLAVQSAMGFLGIWALAAAIRREGRPRSAAAFIIFLTIYPTFVTYEHAVLSEIGTFLFLAMVLNVLLWRSQRLVLRSATLTTVLVAGFYYRPTLLSLTPIAVALHTASLMPSGALLRNLPSADRWKSRRRAAVHGVLILTLTLLAARAWQREPRWLERSGGQFLYGLIRTGVLPETDPLWGDSAGMYQKALEQSSERGHLPFSGLTNGKEYALLSLVSGHSAEGEQIFRRTIAANPGRYLGGVARSLLSNIGLDPSHSENRLFRGMVLSTDNPGSKILSGPESLSALREQFAQQPGPSRIAALLQFLAPVYDLLLLIGFLTGAVALAMALLRRDLVMAIWAVVPIYFCLLHAVILNPIDRLAFPSYPLALAGLFTLPPRMLTPGEWGAPRFPLSYRHGLVWLTSPLIASWRAVKTLYVSHLAYTSDIRT